MVQFARAMRNSTLRPLVAKRYLGTNLRNVAFNWPATRVLTQMIWLAIGLVGGVAVVGTVAVRMRQALINDAQATTKGYL